MLDAHRNIEVNELTLVISDASQTIRASGYDLYVSRKSIVVVVVDVGPRAQRSGLESPGIAGRRGRRLSLPSYEWL